MQCCRPVCCQAGSLSLSSRPMVEADLFSDCRCLLSFLFLGRPLLPSSVVFFQSLQPVDQCAARYIVLWRQYLFFKPILFSCILWNYWRNCRGRLMTFLHFDTHSNNNVAFYKFAIRSAFIANCATSAAGIMAHGLLLIASAHLCNSCASCFVHKMSSICTQSTINSNRADSSSSRIHYSLVVFFILGWSLQAGRDHPLNDHPTWRMSSSRVNHNGVDYARPAGATQRRK